MDMTAIFCEIEIDRGTFAPSISYYIAQEKGKG